MTMNCAIDAAISSIAKKSGKKNVFKYQFKESEVLIMKYYVNESCIGCGLCSGTCPEVFSMSDAGVAVAIEADVPEGALESAAEAMDGCPVGAIEEA